PSPAPFSFRPLSPERAITSLYVLLALTFVLFMALTIVNLQRVSAAWEALEQTRAHSENIHTTAWHNISEVHRALGRTSSPQMGSKWESFLFPVSQEVENVWWNMTHCKAQCGEELSSRLSVLGERLILVTLDPVLQQLVEVKQEQSRMAALLTTALEETRNLSARLQEGIICRKCPKGWKEFGTSCYFFSTTTKPWSSAKDYCASFNAHLVIIDNEEENRLLASHITDNRVFWLGLSDADDEGNWHFPPKLWFLLSCRSWNNGEPNNAGHEGEDCAIIYSSGLWNDIRCSSNEAWICEDPW
ncbi:CLC4M protein, partial [Centropus bengalensis]|nr:CLC4M protein [Centropus bengalensis]